MNNEYSPRQINPLWQFLAHVACRYPCRSHPLPHTPLDIRMIRLAIVVGHNSVAQGAVRPDTGETEYSYNGRLADMVRLIAAERDDIVVNVFRRSKSSRGYTHEIKEVYRRTDEWGATCTCELHFNSHHKATATGTETLTSGTRLSVRYAKALQEGMLEAFGLRDRGVKTVRSGRGAASLISGRAPAALIEPFFGTSSADQIASDEVEEMMVLAQTIIDATVAVFK